MGGRALRLSAERKRMRHMTEALPLLVGWMSLLVGCSSAPAALSGSATDSSGVRLVELPGVAAIKSEWKLNGAPTFRVGWSANGPQLQDVASARFLDSGRIVIADDGTNTVYLLEPSGATAAVLGGKGQGPGEFEAIIGVTPLEADSFLVMDYRNARATVYDGEKFVSDTRLGIPPVYVYDTRSSSPEGRFLVTPWVGYFPNPGWGKAPVMRVDAAFSTADTVMERDVLLVRDRRPDRNPISQRAWLQYGGDMVITARTDRSQVEWRTPDGVLKQVSRWPQRVRDLNGDDWSRYAAAFRMRNSSEPRAKLESTLAAQEADFGGTYPALQQIYAARGGDVWIAQFDLTTRSHRSGRYWILSRSAGWLGYIDLAPRSDILDIDSDRVLVLEYDNLDVQAVAMYQIERSP